MRIAVTDACEIVCGAANPEAIATFLGTLVHGNEMNQLTVELVTPLEITAQCGPGALACYYSGGERMVISGNKDVAPDGATREYITAHEYGHHLANNRRNPPFDPAIAWGTKRWGTYERVCQGARRGIYYPGDQGSRYFENPGEAFAEAFAVNRFRNSGVRWAWIRSLKPNRTSLRQIRADALRPWSGRTRTVVSGRLPKNGRTVVVKRLRTPLDGVLSLRLEGPPRPDFDLVLRDRSGRVLRRSQRDRLGRARQLHRLRHESPARGGQAERSRQRPLPPRDPQALGGPRPPSGGRPTSAAHRGWGS